MESIINKFFLSTTVVLITFSLHARVAPIEMTTFNRKCPTPKLCEIIVENLLLCKKGQKDECNLFVKNFKKALPEYDCQRTTDVTSNYKYIVPAIWLCDTHEYLLDSLSKMKSLKAQKLYGSKDLRNTLDGALAEEHRKKSEKIGIKFSK